MNAPIGFIPLSVFCVCTFVACGNGQSEPEPEVSVEVDLGPFRELARNSSCADVRNRLFLVDNRLVFWDRVGDCPDNSYAQILFAGSVDEELCHRSDSIAGPRQACVDGSYETLFSRIIGHLEEPDLGLGPEHKVEEVTLWDVPGPGVSWGLIER